jgi:hypothetical protein
MNRELRIREVENGYVLEYEEEDMEGNFKLIEKIYQVREEDPDKLMAFQDMLWEIISYFGLTGSKHDPRRLRVEIL